MIGFTEAKEKSKMLKYMNGQLLSSVCSHAKLQIQKLQR